jgi:hypothetical protein
MRGCAAIGVDVAVQGYRMADNVRSVFGLEADCRAVGRRFVEHDVGPRVLAQNDAGANARQERER